MSVVLAWLVTMAIIHFLELLLIRRSYSIRMEPRVDSLIFSALNSFEALLALTLACTIFTREATVGVVVAVNAAMAALFVQTVLLRPFLVGRAALDAPGVTRRYLANYGFLALEAAKTVTLAVAAVLLVGI